MAEEKPVRRKRTTKPKVEAPVEEAAVEVADVAEVKPVKAKPVKAVVPQVEFRRRLSQGDHGPMIQHVQETLASLGYWEGPTNGRYGTMLARAVRRFQGSKNLRVTGDVDIKTWEAMTL
jgi:peptidoglycan hydrolase-like protein with peptidoglycan-binding domain